MIATAAWILFARRLLRDEGAPRSWIAAGIAAAVGGRILLLVPAAPLSDDLYRYLWDGRVANAGINPYAYAPSSAALDSLRGDRDFSDRVNHPDVRTIYPPVAQLFFRALDLLGAGPRGVRAMAAGLDLAAALVLAGVLRRSGRSPSLALVHAACPLAILETSGGGHVDALGVFLLAGAIAMSEALRRVASARFRGGAPARSIDLGEARPRGRRAFVPRATISVGDGLRSFSASRPACSRFSRTRTPARIYSTGFGTYAKHWHYHDFVFSLGVRAGFDPQDVRAALAVAFALTALLVPWFVRERAACIGVVMGAFLVLSPTVHPWYALWLVPFLVFLPRALRPAAFALVALLPLAYVTPWMARGGAEWHEPAWSQALLWVPVTALFAFGLLRDRRVVRRAFNRFASRTETTLPARS